MLTGKKKCKIDIFSFIVIINRHHVDYDLKYFWKEHALTKDLLLNIIKNDQIYQSYLPDNTDLKALFRDYLLSVSLYIYNFLDYNIFISEFLLQTL